MRLDVRDDTEHDNNSVNFGFLLQASCVLLPGTGDPLAAALADEETVAGTPHIFPPRRGVSDGRGLVALWALDNMLQTLSLSFILMARKWLHMQSENPTPQMNLSRSRTGH